MNTFVIENEKLRHNIEQIKKIVEQRGKDDQGNLASIIAVVKGNGYGLGLVPYTQFLIDQGISFFAVATVDEAIALRKAGIKEKVLMLSATAIYEDVKLLVENNIILTLGSKEDKEVIEKIGKEKGMTIPVHLKIDTGFGRYGFVYTKKEELMEAIHDLKHIKIEGTFSHFSISFFKDSYTKKQFDRFMNVIEVLKMNKIETGMLHICNSSAFLKFPMMQLNAVRIGSAFLGRISIPNQAGLKKVGYIESQVSQMKELPKGFNIGYSNTYQTKKETKIAIIPCGYMDGICVVNDRDMFRSLDKLRYIVRDSKDFFKKQAIYVKIGDQTCKVLGRVGTYHVVCDITNTTIKIGDIARFEVNSKFVNPNIRREFRA